MTYGWKLLRYYEENNDDDFRWLYHNTLRFSEDTLAGTTMVPLATMLVIEMDLRVAALPEWMLRNNSVELVVRLRAFRHAKLAVEERPSIPFKRAKHVISIRRYSSRAANALSLKECHESALNNMLRLYSLSTAGITVKNFDIHVSARQPLTIPGVNNLSAWHPVTKALEAVESGDAVIILLHGCDGLSTDIWSIRKLYDYHKSICIYLVIKESDEKLQDGLDNELSERVISHWREGTDGFHYGRFRLADIIDCWTKDECDLTYDDLPAAHLISLWEEAFTQRLELCKAITKIRGSSKILKGGRNLLSRL